MILDDTNLQDHSYMYNLQKLGTSILAFHAVLILNFAVQYRKACSAVPNKLYPTILHVGTKKHSANTLFQIICTIPLILRWLFSSLTGLRSHSHLLHIVKQCSLTIVHRLRLCSLKSHSHFVLLKNFTDQCIHHKRLSTLHLQNGF